MALGELICPYRNISPHGTENLFKIMQFHVSIFFRVAALSIEQLYDCMTANEVVLKEVGKFDITKSLHIMTKYE